MKKEYEEPKVDIEFFNVSSSVLTITPSDPSAGGGYETEDSEENPWG